MVRKFTAEFFGTFWLVFGGCGSAIFAAAWPELGIGFSGVALAFGLTVLTMAYAVGHISGEGKLMTHDEPCSMAPDDKHDLISGTCSHLP